MTDLPTYRLHLLRAGYLLLVLGLGPLVWPGILGGLREPQLQRSVVDSFLGALSLLAVIGLLHPLRMLPLLLFEITWKLIWLASMGYPAWVANRFDADWRRTAFECAGVVILLLLVPWRHVWTAYLAAAPERWR